MILLLFAGVFILISIILLQIGKYMLENNMPVNHTSYTASFVKGSARGTIGMFESNSMLEAKRAKLKKVNSKF